MTSLAGRIVLITGPARGIGAETARLLAARGARLALVGLEPERLAALAAELGAGHFWQECDVTDQRSLEGAVAGAVEALGGLHVVVANAGIATNGTVAVTPADAMARVVDVNLTGVIRTVSATLPHVVRERGYFLLVSSAAAFAAAPSLAVYGATKVAVEHFGTALRLELAHLGVQVGTVHPIWVETELVTDLQGDLRTFEQLLKELPGPFGRVLTVRECAEAFVDAIAHRRRKTFVPKSLAPFAAIRQLTMSAFVERLIARRARRLVPRSEEEVKALGRAFGRNSMGMAKKE